jgi:predicted Zn-dependent protease
MNENDKLGKQLKSFTAWLKTMKKVNIEHLSEQAGPVDHRVEQMAEKSNIEAQIYTEAMAEVYISQGKKKKAIEIYHKLSLQNPSKSSFFANLIESLKVK